LRKRRKQEKLGEREQQEQYREVGTLQLDAINAAYEKMKKLSKQERRGPLSTKSSGQSHRLHDTNLVDHCHKTYLNGINRLLFYEMTRDDFPASSLGEMRVERRRICSRGHSISMPMRAVTLTPLNCPNTRVAKTWW
jgi:hypothetical protein